MKTYLTIIFLSISTITFSQDIENRLSDEKVNEVACAVCSNVNWAKSEGQDMPPWKQTMERLMGFKGNN